MQRHAEPLDWYPKGVSDTLDATESFTGTMASLSNLIPDPTTPRLWQCRPASVIKANFLGGGPFSSGFSSGFATGFSSGVGTGFISCFKVVGNQVFGMIATNRNPGFDEPFCYNLLTGGFVVVTGVAAGTVPASPPTTGAWTPPTLDVIGSKIVVTHIGFAATANFFGWFDISNPAAPVWHAGNLTGAITFATVPTFVAQFFGRAYFIVNTLAQPATVFTDILNPLNVTNATQVLTFGDSEALTALGQLKLWNQAGGIIQGLIVFKGVANCFQVTGDVALSNLAVNALNISTGTLAPLSLTPTAEGLAFLSPEGLRIIDFQANVSDPIGLDGDGVTVPFIYSAVPSRMQATCAGNIIRCTVQNGLAPNLPFQDWWYDLKRKIWHGPHTFPASIMDTYNNSFIMAPIGVNNGLFQSDPVQTASSVFIENGVQMTWGYQTSYLPNTRTMREYRMTETLLDAALSPTAAPINVSALDQNNKVLDSIQISISGNPTLWGQFKWGQALWGVAGATLAPRKCNWHLPLVFSRLALLVGGTSNAQVKMGCLHMRYSQLRYLADIGAA